MDVPSREEQVPASNLQSFRAMAYNNAWANHRLLTACAGLTQRDFEAPRTGFFSSIQAPLNHNMVRDRLSVDALAGGTRGPAAWDRRNVGAGQRVAVRVA